MYALSGKHTERSVLVALCRGNLNLMYFNIKCTYNSVGCGGCYWQVDSILAPIVRWLSENIVRVLPRVSCGAFLKGIRKTSFTANSTSIKYKISFAFRHTTNPRLCAPPMLWPGCYLLIHVELYCVHSTYVILASLLIVEKSSIYVRRWKYRGYAMFGRSSNQVQRSHCDPRQTTWDCYVLMILDRYGRR